jgi:hypothetical protein
MQRFTHMYARAFSGTMRLQSLPLPMRFHLARLRGLGVWPPWAGILIGCFWHMRGIACRLVLGAPRILPVSQHVQGKRQQEVTNAFARF